MKLKKEQTTDRGARQSTRHAVPGKLQNPYHSELGGRRNMARAQDDSAGAGGAASRVLKALEKDGRVRWTSGKHGRGWVST